jgi:hypothetical protein
MAEKERKIMKGEKMDEKNEEYINEYKNMIKEYARMAADHPDMIGQLRAALEASSAMMFSNSPEAVSEFRKMVKEVDAFLQACQTGEVDPQTLWEQLDKEL